VRETYRRTWALDDIAILSRGKGGDGRTVEAYITPFDTPTEIRDQHGHYREEIDRSAFNRTLSHGIQRIPVIYHHAMTLHGTPSELGSVPIGHPQEIRPDGKGLRTVDRYNRSDLAAATLEAIRNGDPMGYSFSGPVFRSTPSTVPRVRPGAALPLVRREELGLTEYGPTPTPAYDDSGPFAVRSAAELAAAFADLDEVARAELIRILSAGTPLDASPADTTTPDPGRGTEDPHEHELAHSRRLAIARQALRIRTRGVLNNAEA
jgi:phage head maturation protease